MEKHKSFKVNFIKLLTKVFILYTQSSEDTVFYCTELFWLLNRGVASNL